MKLLDWMFVQPWFYWFLRHSYRAYAHVFLGLRIEGAEHVPREGGLIVAANHFSDKDPPIVAAATPRMVSFMAKQELFASAWSDLLLRAMRAYPVRRGGTDMKTIRRSLGLLAAGDAIGIFIQGTRSAGDSEALSGAAFLAQRAVVPLQPTAVWLEGRRFRVRFGAPLPVDGDLSREQLTEKLTAAINALLPADRRIGRPV